MLLTLLGVLVVLGGAGAGVFAAAAKPDFGVSAGPTSQSAQQGQAVSYTVRVAGSNGFTGQVALAASGLPAGANAAFSPTSVTLTSTSTSAAATLQVTTAPSTPPGTSSITVTGTSGGKSRSTAVTLTVVRALNGSFTMTAAPASVTVAPGASAVYSLAFTRQDMPDPIALQVARGLPAGTSATFTPNPATGGEASVRVTTTTATKTGSHTLYLVGSAQGKHQYAQVVLVVDTTASAKRFTLSGSPAGALAPGAPPAPIDLVVTNPNNQPLSVTGLTVTVTGTNRAGCTAADFTVAQYSGTFPLVVPKSSTRSLSQLGVAPTRMPKVQMLDLARNQDACKSAAVSLSYSGSAQGN